MSRVFALLCAVLVACSSATEARARFGRVLSQQINFEGAGCGDVAPGPPTNLRATAGNGEVTLNWDGPSNNACVDSYEIFVVPVNAPRTTSAMAPQSTSQFQYTVKNLQNGQEYEFQVTAKANKYANEAETATVKATPKAPTPPPPPPPPPGPVTQLCLTYIRPNGPANLRTQSLTSTSVELCWDPPSNGGCVDYYNLSVEQVSPTARTTASSPIRVQTTQCYTVKDLTPDTLYKASVQSYSNVYNGGGQSSKEFSTKAS